MTLSTTGYGDITPVSAHARLLNVLIVTPLRLLFACRTTSSSSGTE